jgi:hypothetical protein
MIIPAPSSEEETQRPATNFHLTAASSSDEDKVERETGGSPTKSFRLII